MAEDLPTGALIAAALDGVSRSSTALAVEVRELRADLAPVVAYVQAQQAEDTAAEQDAKVKAVVDAATAPLLAELAAVKSNPTPDAIPAWVTSKTTWVGGGGGVGIITVLYLILKMLGGGVGDPSGELTHDAADDDGTGALALVMGEDMDA